MRLFRLLPALLASAAFAMLSFAAAEPSAPAAPPATPESLEPLRVALEEAAATGDVAATRKLFLSRPPIPYGETYRAIHVALADAALDLGLWPQALEYHRAAIPSGDLAWIPGIAFANQDNWDRLDRLIQLREQELRAVPGNTGHPSLPFLRALRATFRSRKLPPAAPEAVALLAEADRESAAAMHPSSAGAPDFNVRFHRLACTVAEATRDPAKIRAACVARAAAFPRHVAFARIALASVIADTDDHDARREFLRSLRLPADEVAAWERACAADYPAGSQLRGENTLAAARALPADPIFDASHLLLLRAGFDHALTRFRKPRRPDGTLDLSVRDRAEFRAEYGAAFSTDARAFAQRVASAGKSATDGEDALLLFELLDLRTAESSALEVALALRANDHARAVRLILAEAPAHADDVKWLARHALFIAESAEPEEALGYLLRVEKLQPDEPRLQLALAGLATRPARSEEELDRRIAETRAQMKRIAEGTALPPPEDFLHSSQLRSDAYRKVFAQTPRKIVPEARHWEDYAALLRSEQETMDFLDGNDASAKASNDEFAKLVERCHAEAPGNAIIAEQYALLLARRAQAAFSDSSYAAFRAAYADADRLGAPLAALAKLQAAFEAHLAKRTANAQAAREAEQARQVRERQERDARLAHERAAEQARAAATQAQRTAVQRLRRELVRRRDHLGGLAPAIADLREKLRGNYDYGNKVSFRQSITALEQELENLCRPCGGLGVRESGRTVTRCSICSGSGQRVRSSAGESAGFEYLTTPLSLD